jgi:osmotically-inducible protein OsmY
MRLLLTVLLALGLLGCRTNESPEKQVTDAEITANVKSELAKQIGPATMTNISVNTTDGVVTLAGAVHSSDEKAKAVSIAQAVPKVTNVNDNLQTSP